jgi:hypothetical protein
MLLHGLSTEIHSAVEHRCSNVDDDPRAIASAEQPCQNRPSKKRNTPKFAKDILIQMQHGLACLLDVSKAS